MSNSREYVYSDKLSDKANSVVNRAIRIANKCKCEFVTCTHLLWALLVIDNECKYEFESITELDANDFIEFINEISTSGKYGKNESDKNISIGQCSVDALKVLTDLANNAKLKGHKAECKDMYNLLMGDTNNEVYAELEYLGCDIKYIEKHIKSTSKEPLNMPTTMKFASDLCELAKNNMLDPISSRDDIMQKVIETLGRRHKANPCLIGDPGVGKTSIVEGLAQRIVAGDVPDYLLNTHILNVDVSGILSGTKYRGDFEERLNNILYEAARNPNVILFFDEFHTLMGAGASDDKSMDAANIIKPALSKGDIRIIGATTTKEYTKFVEKDGAFERRIQPIIVNEPSIEDSIEMINKIVPLYLEFHGCSIDENTIKETVKLADRFITNRKLPDKAINIIDETAARIKANKNKEGIAEKIKIHSDDIKYTISKITGIDINEINDTERVKINRLERELKNRIIGQDNAVNSIIKAIKRSKSGIKDPNRPIGSFLFVGPTGVGKTELTKIIADTYFNGLKDLIRFDMSEFMEKHAVSRLIGAPPGYVGFGDGGQLTEAIKHNPYSIILFDEIEKAHPDVFNVMLQILDEGHLTDSNGVLIDFKNTLIVMTSNAGYGADDKKISSIGFNQTKESKKTEPDESIVLSALESTFRPEFINRIDKIVVFNTLNQKDCSQIVELELRKIGDRLIDRGVKVAWNKDLIEYIAREGFSSKYGARNLKRKVQEIVEDKLADLIIDGELKPGSHIELNIHNNEIMVNYLNSTSIEKELVKA